MSKERDFSAYYFIRWLVILLLCVFYFVSTKNTISFNQFFVTSIFLFIPFILDYYPRAVNTEKLERIRKAGMGVPIFVLLTAVIYLISAYNNEELISSPTPLWLKIISYIGCLVIVLLCFLDYNDVTRKSKVATVQKSYMKKHIETEKVETVEATIKRLKEEQKEGWKKVVLQAQGQNPQQVNKGRRK